MKRIEKAWEVFEAQVVPGTAGEVQRQEMRNAFYGGALSLFHLVCAGVSEGEEVQDDDIELMQDIAREFDEFQASLVTFNPIKGPSS